MKRFFRVLVVLLSLIAIITFCPACNVASDKTPDPKTDVTDGITDNDGDQTDGGTSSEDGKEDQTDGGEGDSDDGGSGGIELPKLDF